MYSFPREQIHFVRLLSQEAHISVKKLTVVLDYEFYADENIYYWQDLLPHAETLVTVSPCEFPPRCLPLFVILAQARIRLQLPLSPRQGP